MSSKSIVSRNPVVRWLGWFLLALVFAVACWNLSQWQLARRSAVVEVINRIDANYAAPASGLEDLMPSKTGFLLSNEYRLVKVSGVYLPEQALLVRNRPRSGQAGFEQLVPLQLVDGSVIFVDRGWLPTGNAQDAPDFNPLPKGDARVTVLGRLRHSEGTDGRNAPAGQIAHAHIAEAASRSNLSNSQTYLGAYLALESENPAYRAPRALGRPNITEGNHLSYAFQWLLFAVMAFGALIWAIRQERLQLRASRDPGFIVKKRRKLGQDDQDYEDAS